jgi:hypothetical protein
MNIKRENFDNRLTDKDFAKYLKILNEVISKEKTSDEIVVIDNSNEEQIEMADVLINDFITLKIGDKIINFRLINSYHLSKEINPQNREQYSNNKLLLKVNRKYLNMITEYYLKGV